MRLMRLILLFVMMATPTAMLAQDELASSAELQQPEIDEQSSVAYVYFAHTSVDTGAIDIYYENQEIPVVTNLGYGEKTDIFRINSGNRLFTVRATGSASNSEPLTTMNWNYGNNTTWVVSAVGLQEKLAFLLEPISILRDDYNGMSRVRVVNYVPDGVRTTVIAEADETVTLGDNLGWIGLGDTMLEAGEYNIALSLDNSGVTSEPVTLMLEENTTYTLLATGRGTDDSPVNLLVFESDERTSSIEFVHEGSQTYDIWYRPAGEIVLEGIDGGTTSELIVLPSGSMTFIAYLPGEAPTGQQKASVAYQFQSSYHYVINITDGDMQISEETLMPLDDVGVNGVEIEETEEAGD